MGATRASVHLSEVAANANSTAREIKLISGKAFASFWTRMLSHRTCCLEPVVGWVSVGSRVPGIGIIAGALLSLSLLEAPACLLKISCMIRRYLNSACGDNGTFRHGFGLWSRLRGQVHFDLLHSGSFH